MKVRQWLGALGAVFFLSCLFSCSPLEKNNFLTGEKIRARVESDFSQKMELVGMQFFDTLSLHPTLAETEALKFLYAYMPLGDVTDYSTAFYLNNVRTAFKAREEMPWGVTIPELIFRHFVLPLRVNNENLDDFRTLYYDELKQRVEGLSMQEAILEVNHWCHEHVTYQPSDARTTSPLATMKAAYGRCGEESTFTVAALRTIGIPARQVYTPRWAHTDDNHAWVEAWADGQWWFMGACEPEPVLNLGWFNAAASRAMLMHTRVFGHYEGPEEQMLETPTFTEINLIDNYGSTSMLQFCIVDAEGHPVPEAKVDFMIYNYAEFCPVVTKYADEKGETFLSAGKGDMLVWASKNGNYGYAKAAFAGNAETVTIVLDRKASTDAQQQAFPLEQIDVVPPVEQAQLPEVSDSLRQANNRRFAYEDSLRQAYMSTFLSRDEALRMAESLGYKAEERALAADYLVKSRGNHAVIRQFLTHGDLSLLQYLSDKDLRDISTEVLEDYYNHTPEGAILNPRVENEMLVPFKAYLLENIPADLQASFKEPTHLVSWCQEHIRVVDEAGEQRYAISSPGVWKSRVANARSRDIFFVDVARLMGIDARKDAVTGKVQYRQDGRWIDVDFEASSQEATPQGTLVLNYQAVPGLDNPQYYSHFTLSKIEDGQTHLLSFDEGQVDMGGGVSWSNTFKNGTMLDEGTYLLVSGRRMASGNVAATMQIFNVKAGETTTLDLVIRESTENEVAVIGSFDSESKYNTWPDEKEQSILTQTGRGYFVIGVLGVGQEPTNHALRDIAKMKNELDKWGRPFVLLFPDEAQARRFNAADYGELPANTAFGIDKDGAILKQIQREMKLLNANLPVFIIADTFNRVVFVTQGYTIGLGEQLQQVVMKLN